MKTILALLATLSAAFAVAIALVGCNEDGARLAPVAQVAHCAPAALDASAPDASEPDAAVPPPYMCPPPISCVYTDASMCTPVDVGVKAGVPGIRWAPGATCWYTSAYDPEDLDQICEDQLPDAGWCQLFGLDYTIPPNIPPCIGGDR